MKPFITVYAISKNEEKNVERWCNSMLEADAVVVLDAGSTDNTVEELKKRGVKVETQIITPWRFDTARNESLKLCPPETDLYVCTDLDEAFASGWADILRNEYDSNITRYYYLYSSMRNGIEDNKHLGDKIHAKNYEWVHVVHEELKIINDTERIKTLPDLIHLYHTPDWTKDRDYYVDLLKVREQEEPTNWLAKIPLAIEYLNRGRTQECIDKINEILEMDYGHYANDQLEEATCYLFLGKSYKELNNTEWAIFYFEKTLSIIPDYRVAYIYLAEIYLELNEYDLVIEVLKKALELTDEKISWIEPEGAWSYKPYDLLSLAYWYKGENIKSIAAAAKAVSLNEMNDRLKNNLNICLNLTKNIDFCK